MVVRVGVIDRQRRLSTARPDKIVRRPRFRDDKRRILTNPVDPVDLVPDFPDSDVRRKNRERFPEPFQVGFDLVAAKNRVTSPVPAFCAATPLEVSPPTAKYALKAKEIGRAHV